MELRSDRGVDGDGVQSVEEFGGWIVSHADSDLGEG